ncbi:RHS repeat-associated core domain-containing protein [Gilliamella apicola]|uniref:RHS repeat-associated core domain-containing protein n=1 Tax=Gilliamella apicola TaxID=1196095 RepID=UPI00117B6A91|nr:RHS repeat-associated core domain-containing protein [Gilliamella apicola]
MIQETGPNHPTSLYIYTDQNSYEPLARIDTDGNQEQHIRYFHTDLNGCPEELTDANGKILWECSFQLWGKRIHEIEHEPIEQNLRYQGQYLDRETGLHYNTFRYYDPDIGRFTQPDPIGLLGGLNLYQYAPNGFTWIDPLGLSCSFDSKSNRWRNNETGRFNKRPTDPSELVHNGQIKYNDVTKWANQGGISNQWMSSSQFPSGGFKYQTNSNGITYSVHGHGTNPNAVARYPSSNAAKGPTASITTRPTGGAHSAQTNTLSNGTKVNSRGRDDVQMNQSHIPLINSPF